MNSTFLLVENLTAGMTKYSLIDQRKVVFAATSQEPLNTEEVEMLRADPASLLPQPEGAAA